MAELTWRKVALEELRGRRASGSNFILTFDAFLSIRSRVRLLKLSSLKHFDSNIRYKPIDHFCRSIYIPLEFFTMNNLLRSKSGCWTCRLRKKKCDERKPSPCSTCESLAITCYGYGTKPDWMDNGAREKEMANSIKQIVKHTSRRKGRLTGSNGGPNNGLNTEASIMKIAPKTATAPIRITSTASEDAVYQKTSSVSSAAQSSPSVSAETSMVR